MSEPSAANAIGRRCTCFRPDRELVMTTEELAPLGRVRGGGGIRSLRKHNCLVLSEAASQTPHRFRPKTPLFITYSILALSHASTSSFNATLWINTYRGCGKLRSTEGSHDPLKRAYRVLWSRRWIKWANMATYTKFKRCSRRTEAGKVFYSKLVFKRMKIQWWLVQIIA